MEPARRGPFAHRFGAPLPFDERDRREQIQLIVDLPSG
jgi:hypothetical protein